MEKRATAASGGALLSFLTVGPMCGIFGAVGPIGSGPPLADHDIVRLRDTMSDRGPDGAGHLSRGHVVLAHRRLSIRDRSAPAQPWHSDDRSVAVVYNGEIYNDAELRSVLGQHGFRFRTRCDTELLPAAYLHWGAGFVERLRGDFAIGLYDFRRHRLLLARDRCGTKPLFFGWIGRSLLFASTIRVLRQHPEFKPEPDWRTISHYLTTLRLTLDERTVFRGVSTLQPGERLVYERGRVKIEQYWQPPLAEDSGSDFEAATEAFETRLREAVTIRLCGDVPAGLFLSGGVDSNTIASIVRDETGSGLAAACGEGYDVASPGISGDAACASIAARYTGCDLAGVRVRPETYLETWQSLLDDYETPVSTPTDAILFHVAQTMKQSAGFALGGEGADELLCGYAAAHYSGHDYERSRRLHDGRWSPETNIRRLFNTSLRRSYGQEQFVSPVDHYFALNSLIASESKPLMLSPQVWDAAAADESMRASYERRLAEHDDRPASERILRLLYRVNLEALLSRLDSAAMRASLEVRPVYTDHLLVEETFRRPESFKIDVAEQEPAKMLSSSDLAARGSLRDKRMLRCVASRLMPQKLASRPKASFPTPVATWLAHDWRHWVSRTIRESPFAAFMLQPRVRDAIAADPGQLGMRLWPLLNVALWGDRQFA